MMARLGIGSVVLLALALPLAGCGGDDGQGALREVKSETFQLDDVTMTSNVVEVETHVGEDSEPYWLTWHYVEAGQGEPVVFIHGLPESWYSWHYQLEDLAADYRVIAVDLKGYGQSDKADGDYSSSNVAREIAAFLESIGVEEFNLVTHDWGTAIGDFIAGGQPGRVKRYVRMQAPVLRAEPENHRQFVLFRDQELATRIMGDTDAFVQRVYGSRTVQPIAEQDMARIAEEFGREGVAEAVPRYFRDFTGFARDASGERAALFDAMDLPVLLLQADSDPAQPTWYFDGATEAFPNAELRWVESSGHFSELEQPEAVVEAIRDFLRR